jgi:hypothetical protein
MTYRDLAEHGVMLVTQDDPTFDAMVREIQVLPRPFGPPVPAEPNRAAVLVNDSGKAIVVVAVVWRYTTAEGTTRTSRFANLGSSLQLDVLTGRGEVTRDVGSFILPGSKRLISEQGVFGNNLDVLPETAAPRGHGWAGSFGGGRQQREDAAAVELSLDLAVFEDCTCAGPDEAHLVESLTASLEQQRDVAQQALTALRSGASVGQIFELVRPLARHTPPHDPPLLNMFGNMAIHQLVRADDAELLAWLEKAAQKPSRRLRRV